MRVPAPVRAVQFTVCAHWPLRCQRVTINMNGSIGARGSVNSKTELIGILRTLPGGDSNVPSSWRARPPVTTGTKRKGV